MIDRRQLLGWALAAPALLIATAPAAAAPRPGRLYDGRQVPPHGGGPLPTRLALDQVRLGRARRVRAVTVFSQANANDRFVAVVEVDFVPRRSMFLTVAGGAVPASSWGSGFAGRGRGSLTFTLDAAMADELCQVLGVPRHDRAPLGAGLAGRWRPRAQPFALGHPMELVVAITHGGGDPVAMSVGGRQRGPRDNRFGFTVTRAGQPLPVLDAPDFGGVMGYRRLAPGDVVELAADLAAWVTIDQPGTYDVRCQHQVELTPTEAGAPWPAHGHETWDRTFSATVPIVVV
ncbi:MAG: hypothetical protein IPL61_34840 [Myxococcales bacterium]|nr:hypothetical protein [Myxococcales bacterium]